MNNFKNRKTNEIEKRVFEYIEKENLITDGDTLILAVSGGSDSVFLLYILLEFRKQRNKDFKIVISHLNHKLRDESKRDEDFTRNLAEKNNLQFFSKEVNILNLSKNNKESIEETGRKERYIFFEEVILKLKEENKEQNKNQNKRNRENKYKIVTGHNSNDVVETMILNLSRGSGLRGISSIESKSKNIIRPILSVFKDEIEEYLKLKEIDFVVDHTNFENDYTRNKIRNVVIPYLENNVNKGSLKNIFFASERFKENLDFVEKNAENVFNELIFIYFENEKTETKVKEETKLNNIKSIQIELEDFNNLHIVLKKEIIYLMIKKFKLNISKLNDGIIEDIINIANNRSTGKKVIFDNIWKFKIKNKRLILEKR